jgi:hypothetical protein
LWKNAFLIGIIRCALKTLTNHKGVLNDYTGKQRNSRKNFVNICNKEGIAARNLFLAKTNAHGLCFGIQFSEGRAMKKRILY